jgi:predicted TIM-barrel fold metal-dependent hydrolase
MGDAPTPDEVRLANDVVLQAMDLSDRFVGFCFLNPGYAREALQEVERCVVDGGMVGIKLYHQYRVNDPAQRPVMDRAAELGVPVLMHAGKVMDARTRARQPRLSNAAHFGVAAAMFPDTTLIQAHIGGGGDWEWNLRVLETCPPNVHIDTSGSVIDRGIVDRTIAAMGVERVLFATDGSLEEGIGKVLEADLSPEDRARVLAGNARALLANKEEG